MLTDKIAELKGKTTSNRVLPGPTGNVIESSYTGFGKLLGIEVRDLGRHTTTLRSDGTLVGEGYGVYMGKSGEHADWTGHGVGLMQKDGSIEWRGQFIISTTSEPWKGLNQFPCTLEVRVDSEGNHVGSLRQLK